MNRINHSSRFIEMFGNLESKKRLGDVASYINGFAFKPSDWSSTGLPIIRIQNLTGTNEIYNYYNGDYPDQVEVNNGDILISWSATLGVYVWTEGKALLNQHIFKVSFDKGYINRDYFIYAVTQKLDEMSTKTHGTTMRHIVKSDFDNTIIPFPSIEGQDRFALVAKQADKSKFIGFKSRFIEMFGDPFKNEKGWSYYSLSKVTTIVLGTTPSSSNPAYWDGDIKWITPAELNDDSFYVFDSERHISEAGVRSTALKPFPEGTVIFSTRAPIGKTAIAGCEMYCNQGFKNFICSDKLNPVYLFYTLRSHKEELQKMGTGSTFLELSKKTIEGLSISIPPRELQDEFEVIYKQADKSKYLN